MLGEIGNTQKDAQEAWNAACLKKREESDMVVQGLCFTC